jgi:hypothetical protein
MIVEDKESYYRERAIGIQRGIVTFKSSTTRTTEALIWTYRTTSCDVISMITTTVPVKDGHMKDIRLEKASIRRYYMLFFCTYFIFSNLISGVFTNIFTKIKASFHEEGESLIRDIWR